MKSSAFPSGRMSGATVSQPILKAVNRDPVALRADFDALPIQDEKDVPYASQIPGVMHACGHDYHTAALLAVGKVLYRNREKLKGSFVMIHQHAEELSPGGAKAMIEDGCLEHVDAIFGTHLWATEPVGTVLCRPSIAADGFTIKVIGKGTVRSLTIRKTPF